MKFCWHTYGKWSKAQNQSVSVESSRKMQVTTCTKCGAILLRYIPCSSYINASIINTALNTIQKED